MKHYGEYVKRYTSTGDELVVWQRNKAVRIANEFLGSTVFLYKSARDATEGTATGASGFFTAVLMPVDEKMDSVHVYVVTARHVIARGCTVVRANTVTGGHKILEYAANDWVGHPAGDDIAVCPIAMWSQDIYGSTVVPDSSILTEADLKEYDIGPGDEVFMNGRFLPFDGDAIAHRNTPFVRFGNISSMPLKIENRFTRLKQESFIVEMRSISGYSGSPVLVHIPPKTARPRGEGYEEYPEWRTWLLGVDWGHLPHYGTVTDKDGNEHPEELKVRSSSAMSAVVPGWKLLELLNTEELVEQRRKEIEADRSKQPHRVVLDFDDDKPREFTKEDFEDALKKVSRRVTPSKSDEGT